MLQHWEGLARVEEAQQLAKGHGGTARQVSAPAAASTRTGHRRGVTWLYSVLAAALIFAASLPAFAATVTAAARSRALSDIPFSVGFLFVVAIFLVAAGDKAMLMGREPSRARAARRLKFIFGMPFCWLVLALVHAETGRPNRASSPGRSGSSWCC